MGGGLQLSKKGKKQFNKIKDKNKEEDVSKKYSFIDDEINKNKKEDEVK